MIPFEAGGKRSERAFLIKARHCRCGYEGIEEEIRGDKELNLYAIILGWVHTQRPNSAGCLRTGKNSVALTHWYSRYPSAPRGGGTTLYNVLYGEAPLERGTFFTLQVYERVGISAVEVYERVGKSVTQVFKRPLIKIFNFEHIPCDCTVLIYMPVARVKGVL